MELIKLVALLGGNREKSFGQRMKFGARGGEISASGVPDDFSLERFSLSITGRIQGRELQSRHSELCQPREDTRPVRHIFPGATFHQQIA